MTSAIPPWEAYFQALTSIPGKEVTSDPVATIMFLALIIVSVLSADLTVTSLTPVIVP